METREIEYRKNLLIEFVNICLTGNKVIECKLINNNMWKLEITDNINTDSSNVFVYVEVGYSGKEIRHALANKSLISFNEVKE